MNLTEKQKLSFRMRRYARLAAQERLSGRMQRASYWDDQIEKVYGEARRRRLGEGFLVRAEEKGRQEGGRRHSEGRDNRRSVRAKRRPRGERGPRRMGHTTVDGVRYNVPDYAPHAFRGPQQSKTEYMRGAKHYANLARKADRAGNGKAAKKYRAHARKLLKLAKRYRGVYSRDRGDAARSRVRRKRPRRRAKKGLFARIFG